MWAAAAFAPAAEDPTFRTATRTSCSAATASAEASFAPSPSDSQNSATERTPSSSATASSQSLASQTAWLPVETSVCQPMPRREFSAFTATLPLWETIATGPAGTPAMASPHIGAPPADRGHAVAVGPQMGRRPGRGDLEELALELLAGLQLAEAGRDHDGATAARARSRPGSRRKRRPPESRPRPRRPGREDRARSGRTVRPCTSVRLGLMPQTSPANPAVARLRITRSAYEPTRSFAPTTAIDVGSRSGCRSTCPCSLS